MTRVGSQRHRKKRLLLMCCLLTIFVGPATLGVHAVVVGTFYVMPSTVENLQRTVFAGIMHTRFIFSIRHGAARERVLLLFVV